MNTDRERAAFEAWYRHHHGNLDVYALDESGEYVDKQVQGAFNVWIARAALSQDREDAERLDWLQQHDERFYNLLRITSIVNKGFSPTNNSGKQWFSSIREAIDHARRVEGEGE